MQNPEQSLVLELAAVAAGEPLPSTAYLEVGGDLAGSLRSGGSANWPVMSWAIRYGLLLPNGREQWIRFFQETKTAGFMGDEEFSAIYWTMHLAGVAVVAHFAALHRDADLLAAARAWLTYWFGICALVECPDGHVLLPGMRSAGHSPEAGATLKEWMLAIARGDGGARQRWEAVGHDQGLGLNHNFAWLVTVAQVCADDLRAAWAPLAGLSAEQIGVSGTLLPWALDAPIHVYRTPRGVAAWLERQDNPNTAAWLAAVWVDGTASWGPKDGGPGRWREHGDPSTVTREGNVLHYRSEHYGDVDLQLPPGEAWEVTLGAGEQGVETPRPPSPVPVAPSSPPSADAAEVPESLLADLSSLRLARADAAQRIQILADLATHPPGRPYGELAAAVDALGINPDSPQGATQRSIAARLRALG